MRHRVDRGFCGTLGRNVVLNEKGTDPKTVFGSGIGTLFGRERKEGVRSGKKFGLERVPLHLDHTSHRRSHKKFGQEKAPCI